MSQDEAKGKEKEIDQLKKQVEELKKQIEKLSKPKEEKEPTPTEQMKEATKLLKEVGGVGIIGGLVDGIGNLVELAEKIKDPNHPLHKKLNVEYSIRTTGLLGDRHITSGGEFFARARRRGVPPATSLRTEEQKKAIEELRELRRLKEEFLRAEKEREKAHKEEKPGDSE